MKNKIIHGDCIEEMKKMPESSVDAIITDPPYGLEFMGKEWDSLVPERGRHTGKDVKMFGNFKEKNMHNLPKLSQTKNPKCKHCGVYRFDHPRKNKRQAECKHEFIHRHFGNEQQAWHYNWCKEALRVLKPGGHLLAFGGTRTYHRLTCAVEDAGFQIRDCLMWIYGSGFPKSLNIGKIVDKLQGNERKIVGYDEEFIKKNKLSVERGQDNKNRSMQLKGLTDNQAGYKNPQEIGKITEGNSEWEGWGTALKPAYEPIVLAMKPVDKNFANNVLTHGVGGLNIDACRIGTEENLKRKAMGFESIQRKNAEQGYRPRNYLEGTEEIISGSEKGRFPANVILDEEAGRILDEQSGELSNSSRPNRLSNNVITPPFKGFSKDENTDWKPSGLEHNDSGGASRFFYCAKASRSERNAGLDELEDGKPQRWNKAGEWTNDTTPSKNSHPTVKPIKLMEYLIKLVTRPEHTILDPFVGSGTTNIAAYNLERTCIGIEKEKDYVKIARARLKDAMKQQKLNIWNKDRADREAIRYYRSKYKSDD